MSKASFIIFRLKDSRKNRSGERLVNHASGDPSPAGKKEYGIKVLEKVLNDLFKERPIKSSTF